ncbi:hypothetical protein J1N35_028509 [Gossypium stocksii]|uniref:Uncharacterized protein n=1 Tax=Gossypium stocksii TaxID=47602 RepID=A0A9D3UWF4_9ROSI|nr:hypothetical protein J1N35_028509 [Gossypium stocksii]
MLQSYLPLPSPFVNLHIFTHSTETAIKRNKGKNKKGKKEISKIFHINRNEEKQKEKSTVESKNVKFESRIESKKKIFLESQVKDFQAACRSKQLSEIMKSNK